jgi:hypothetical protein
LSAARPLRGLISLAWAILGDRLYAESVVVEVIADACARPGVATTDAAVRQELARLTYQACLRSRPATAGRRLPDRRAALELILIEDHICLDVADLIGLPVDTVADLVCSFPRDIRRDADSDRRPAELAGPGHGRAHRIRRPDPWPCHGLKVCR